LARLWKEFDMMPRKILLATDDSEGAQAAEGLVAGLADALGSCEVSVATVIRPIDLMHTTEGRRFAPPRAAGMKEDAQEMVKEVADRLRERIKSPEARVEEHVLEDWSPASAIITAAHRGGECSLIVLGSRGRGGFASLALGSVSTQVVHGAHCPVMVARA
jgi:nucleotide-binding universal stress UspA family protein